MLTKIIYGTFQIIELWWKLKHEKCTLGSTFTMYSNFHVKYMHFIKCNRIIIFYDPDLDTCALSAVRGDGPSPVWLLVCKASELVEIHHLIPSCAGPQAIRAWTRWCRCRRQASVTSRQTAQNACLLCFARKKGKPLIKKKKQGKPQPNQSLAVFGTVDAKIIFYAWRTKRSLFAKHFHR